MFNSIIKTKYSIVAVVAEYSTDIKLSVVNTKLLDGRLIKGKSCLTVSKVPVL